MLGSKKKVKYDVRILKGFLLKTTFCNILEALQSINKLILISLLKNLKEFPLMISKTDNAFKFSCKVFRILK